MAQRTQIVAELKRALRGRGITYAHVAKHLGLSEASVKRLFAAGDFSLERLDLICELAGLEMSELVEQMREQASPVNQLTLAQEQEVVADSKLFLMTWLVLNRWQLDDIVRTYDFTQREALRYLIKLDRLRIIELQPGNRTRVLVSRHFAWRPGGPVHNYIHQKLIKEFLATHFHGSRDEFIFHGGVVSAAAFTQIKRALQSAVRECTEVMDRDRAVPLADRSGAAFLVALRPWQFSGFSEFIRKNPPPLVGEG
ncbi:MAG TPA: helix-turn-helix transcriptional regulator [Steroidobacteraceae bacterium]|nr:helix-turn-helix transcriptional regulator [Steroidobacteraceae bacterium]